MKKNNRDIVIAVRLNEKEYKQLINYMELSKETCRSRVIRDAIVCYTDVMNLLKAVSEEAVFGTKIPEDLVEKGGNNNA